MPFPTVPLFLANGGSNALTTPCKSRSIPLNPSDLENLVVADLACRRCVSDIVRYIQTVNQAGGPPLFHPDQQDGTRSFALEFARMNDDMKQRWECETQDAERRRTRYWQDVVQKKKRLDELRQKESALKREISEMEVKRGRDYECEVQYKRRNLASLKNDINSALVAPHFIVNPLPQDADRALCVLFFFMMPTSLCALAKLLFSAQTKLVPSSLICRLRHQLPDNSNDWQSHYVEHDGRHDAGSELVLCPHAISYSVPHRFGITNVDYLGSSDDCQKCMWYPDYQTLFSPPGNINPFQVTDCPNATRGWFIEPLHDSDDPQLLKWALAFPAVANHASPRGNEGYAKLDSGNRPSWLNVNSFLACAGLRSFPYQQVRKITGILRDRTLPLGRPCIQTLLRMAMFQMGPPEGNWTLWHSDLRNPEFVDALVHVMKASATRLRPAIRDHRDFPILAHLSAFVSQLLDKEDLRPLFTAIAADWAELLGKRLQSGRITPEEAVVLKCKQCLMFAYGILSISDLGTLSHRQAASLCALVVRHHNAFVFIDDISDDDLERALRDALVDVGVKYVMTRRIDAMSDLLEDRDLTNALRCIVGKVPQSLVGWSRYESTQCYEVTASVEGRSDHYMLNALDGTVLVNGSPPGRLPRDVVENALYRRHFGDRQFEVVTHPDGTHFETTRALDTLYYYEFDLRSDRLVVRETNTSTKETLELVDAGVIRQSFGDLPVRLHEMHSHWVLVDRNKRPPAYYSVMVLRGIPFDGRSVDFIVCNGLCCAVELHERGRPVRELLATSEGMKKFVHVAKDVHDGLLLGNILSVFEKFEDRRFIHVLTTGADAGVLIDLPRYRLSFRVERNGEAIVSNDYAGRVVSWQQQLPMLPLFRQYLVLVDPGSTPSLCDTWLSAATLLIPDGKVVVDERGEVVIELDDCCAAKLNATTMEWNALHQTFRCSAPGMLATRLQMAAILAAAGTMVPEPLLGMTGSEAALQLVRQCWVNRPLSDTERERLANVSEFSHREPTLAIVCDDLLRYTTSFEFLYSNGQSEAKPEPDVAQREAENDLLNASFGELRSRMRSPIQSNRLRQWLLPGESIRPGLFAQSSLVAVRSTRVLPTVERLPRSPVGRDVVKQFEAELRALLVHSDPSGSVPEFPIGALDSKKQPSKVFEEVLRALERSWGTHHQLPRPRRSSQVEVMAVVRRMAARVDALVDVQHQFLKTVLIDNRDPVYEWLLLSNRAPVLCFTDLLRIALRAPECTELMPFLSSGARDDYRSATLTFLELLVLRGRLCRIVQHEGNEAMQIRELETFRQWDTSQHAGWLVFEVEGDIQIRPEQYAMARHLLDNAGAISQLNMGMGKTRVILPMLIIDAVARGDRVRVNVLDALWHETLEYYRLHLTASALAVRIAEFPFSRDVDVGKGTIELLKQVLACSNCFVVAPQHRVSLILKIAELRLAEDREVQSLANLLHSAESSVSFRDIFDESDALLHYRYALVYAVGTPTRLEHCDERITAACILLRAINRADDGARLGTLLARPGFSTRYPAGSRGDFSPVHLAARQDRHNDPDRQLLRQLIAAQLLDGARTDDDLDWLDAWSTRRASDELREALLRFLADDEFEDERSLLTSFPEDHRPLVLALRGLLAFGRIEFALEQRNRVNYGIDVHRRPKRLAVPFVAADVPSSRSEFADPDISILLTTLAYYHDGIGKRDVRDAFDRMLGLGAPAQARLFQHWIGPIQQGLTDDEAAAIGDVSRIDLTNDVQLDLLHSKLKHSTELINFWVKSFVLPSDTAQYPQRMMTSAWHLAASTSAVGFSGTNDVHLLLPLQVTRREPNIDRLLATDGSMLNCIVDKTLQVETLPRSDSTALWQCLLEHVAGHATEFRALIDVGSFLAGVPNEKAARFLAGQRPFADAFRAIYFFNNKPGAKRCWMVLDTEREQIMEQSRSPIAARDSFVIFDDARTRGADLKLAPTATAVVTIGQKLSKDRLMQGAGRLRQLVAGEQQLSFVMTDAVEGNVRSSLGLPEGALIQTTHVLQWTLQNTCLENEVGLWQWAQKGTQFLKNGDCKPVDDDFSLSFMYGSKATRQTVSDAAKGAFELEPDVQERMGSMFGDVSIRGQCERYGQEVIVAVTSSMNEECERELQVEQEEQKEQEREIEAMQPHEEQAWKYGGVLQCDSLVSFSDAGADALPVGDALSGLSIDVVNWEQAKLWATANFMRTVEQGEPCLDYLRVADVVVVFENDHAVLLLSDQEADGVLEAICRSKQKTKSWRLGHVSCLRARDANGISTTALSAVGLFNGETTFPESSYMSDLEALLSTTASHNAAKDLIHARGLSHNYDCSQLKTFINHVSYDNRAE